MPASRAAGVTHTTPFLFRHATKTHTVDQRATPNTPTRPNAGTTHMSTTRQHAHSTHVIQQRAVCWHVCRTAPQGHLWLHRQSLSSSAQCPLCPTPTGVGFPACTLCNRPPQTTLIPPEHPSSARVHPVHLHTCPLLRIACRPQWAAKTDSGWVSLAVCDGTKRVIGLR